MEKNGERQRCSFFFFFNDTATTEIYTLSLHDALPISAMKSGCPGVSIRLTVTSPIANVATRSEEHTSELQSPCNLVCRLLLEKKKQTRTPFFSRAVRHPLNSFEYSAVDYTLQYSLHTC